jgi:hypothetical protein
VPGSSRPLLASSVEPLVYDLRSWWRHTQPDKIVNSRSQADALAEGCYSIASATRRLRSPVRRDASTLPLALNPPAAPARHLYGKGPRTGTRCRGCVQPGVVLRHSEARCRTAQTSSAPPCRSCCTGTIRDHRQVSFCTLDAAIRDVNGASAWLSDRCFRGAR